LLRLLLERRLDHREFIFIGGGIGRAGKMQSQLCISGEKTLAELREDTEIEAGIGQLQSQSVFPVNVNGCQADALIDQAKSSG